MRIGLLSDIHGNIWALEAVIEDARKRGITQFLDLGDTLQGPFDPEPAANVLMELPITGILGNHDHLQDLREDQLSPTDQFHLKLLTEAQKEWLARRKSTAVIGDQLFLFHGTPHSDQIFLLDEPSRYGGILRSEEEILDAVNGVNQVVLICGHTHVPRLIHLEDGRLVINPGSVGLQAYDLLPQDGKIEMGSPHARYAVLSDDQGEWQVDFVELPYDWKAASTEAHHNGCEDWARWLLTGRL